MNDYEKYLKTRLESVQINAVQASGNNLCIYFQGQIDLIKELLAMPGRVTEGFPPPELIEPPFCEKHQTSYTTVSGKCPYCEFGDSR